MVHGLWFMVCGLLLMACDLWFMVHGLWFGCLARAFRTDEVGVCGLWGRVSSESRAGKRLPHNMRRRAVFPEPSGQTKITDL